MKRGKLRIAWSVAWGIAALLLVALWVRSYWRWDSAGVKVVHDTLVGGNSISGQIECGFDGWSPAGIPLVTSYRIGDVPLPLKDPENSTVCGFGFHVNKWRGRLDFPHCFGVLALSAAAAMPWLRFSLRTLLIATTLIAVGLGLIVWLAGAR